MKIFNGFRKQKNEALDEYEKNFLETSDAYIAKVEGKKHVIGFLLKSFVVVATLAVATSFASCTLFGQKNDPEKEPTKTEQTKTDDETNNNNNVIVNPGDENQNGENNKNGENNQNGENGQNGGNENGEQNGNENGGENNEDPNHNENGGENSGENSGENGNSGENNENGNSGENQGENGNSGENQGENQGENNGENGENNGNENPEGPNQEDPNQGGQETPQPERLDFSGLEAKLVEVITSQSKYNKVNEIISYSINKGKFYVVIDYEAKHGSRIGLYNMETSEGLSTQESINQFCSDIVVENFSGLTFGKASSDITVDDQTYSKDGIEGDNPFARQCGVENAWMTYVSDIGKPVLNPNSSTNYFSGYQVLVVFLKDGEIYIRNQPINVECEKGYSEQKILEASLSGEHYVGGELQLSELINLGINLKNPKVAQASDWELGYSFN